MIVAIVILILIAIVVAVPVPVPPIIARRCALIVDVRLQRGDLAVQVVHQIPSVLTARPVMPPLKLSQAGFVTANVIRIVDVRDAVTVEVIRPGSSAEHNARCESRKSDACCQTIYQFHFSCTSLVFAVSALFAAHVTRKRSLISSVTPP